MKLAFSKFLSLIGLITATWGPFAMAAEIQDLNWMSGQWAGTYQGLPMEAQYPSGSGGMVLGLTKIANGKETEFFEFEEIVEVGNSLVLRQCHSPKKAWSSHLKR